MSRVPSIWDVGFSLIGIATPDHNLDEETFERWYEHNIAQYPSRPGSVTAQELLWQHATALGEVSPKKRRSLNWTRSVAIEVNYNNSILSVIPAVLFVASFGITQLIMIRQNKPSISKSENLVDFGQIFPLLMLSLPLMTAIDTYNEKPNSSEAGDSEREVAITSFTAQLPIASGLTIHQDHPRSIALDPELLSLYSRKNIQNALLRKFLIYSVLFIATGVAISFRNLWLRRVGYVIVLVFGGLFQCIDYGNWIFIVISKVIPPSGTRAPAPSLNGDSPPRTWADLSGGYLKRVKFRTARGVLRWRDHDPSTDKVEKINSTC
ncbi:hypothetical protein BDZ45DRAFT_746026 [Acephala macrosclerotiorum]|nr:hypothetical protein BDZ45DRAFT_746026 [Acephala macrosclerotiorum]